ncbi:hypothetical protein E2F50_13430 [Rhizobium deserti]|uniref:Uncharacterized protein n=1 Tax=Rhizobium deserti TaxID=2547961 RepID=A0A4R5UH31_9HYPH|nr:hypothetical protein [Rhizobium deserti]TDK35254.1 hypothetical protein E2F50_13430 [Rhizobium deserti]
MQTYHRYRPSEAAEGALIIKFYHSGDQIRGYIRKITDERQDDSIFPGEEMEPEDAFRMADNKNRDPGGQPIFIELSEGVQWDPAWGKLI